MTFHLKCIHISMTSYIRVKFRKLLKIENLAHNYDVIYKAKFRNVTKKEV